MPPVSVLIKPASGMCNLRCEYCFYCDEASKRAQKSFGMMSEETLKNVIRRTLLRAEGYASYAFQGGASQRCGGWISLKKWSFTSRSIIKIRCAFRMPYRQTGYCLMEKKRSMIHTVRERIRQALLSRCSRG